ncbi:MAG: hypothetical protein COZ18_03460 [Flexibacter sp. CG_4_10_14_3_um_filter_32_15]|nr:MAG: hypothetical protein COZ18_03460 [Flexibacter sp. CG_4_10_14_3_um_filter_32_15]
MKFYKFVYTILLFLALLFIETQNSFAQTNTSSFVPYQSDYYHILKRYEIKRGKFFKPFHSSTLPLSRSTIALFADSLALDSTKNYSQSDKFNINYLLTDNYEFTKKDSVKQKGILKYFYKRKPDFLSVMNENYDMKLEKGALDFVIRANPILHLGVGQDNTRDEMLTLNTRGAEIHGVAARRIGFYASVTETQAIFPRYVQNVIDSLSPDRSLDNFVVPNEAFAKPFKENGVDFLRVRGYITFNVAKVVDVQFGNDNNFIGNGYRSLVLSDFAPPHLFLKLQTKFWKINYTNLYTQMVADVQRANSLYPKKYVIYHHLSIDITKKFNLGVFESVAYGRKDQGQNDTFDLSYLNPFIFYRAVEQGIGSIDNALVGADFKWLALKDFQLYGQFVLDELKVGELVDNNGWWGNKYGIQLGLNYIDFANIKNLDLQLETNIVRPYTYTHSSDEQLSNFVHYRQSLAHPLGANFMEFLGVLRYQPIPRLTITGKFIYAQTGEDSNGSNWGSNLLISNVDVDDTNEYGNTIGQGIETNILFGRLTATYQLYHNLFIDADVIHRNKTSALVARDLSSTVFSVGMRLNIGQRLYEF